jgi:hypothetical protein
MVDRTFLICHNWENLEKIILSNFAKILIKTKDFYFTFWFIRKIEKKSTFGFCTLALIDWPLCPGFEHGDPLNNLLPGIIVVDLITVWRHTIQINDIRHNDTRHMDNELNDTRHNYNQQNSPYPRRT